MTNLQLDGPLVLVGAGKMGGAMLAGLIARGLNTADVTVQDPAPPPEMDQFLKDNGIKCAPAIEALSTPPSVILMAVKPQKMDAVFPSLAKFVGENTIVLSIAAGRSIASFQTHLNEPAAIVRAMPNTPAAIGKGITVCCPSPKVAPAQRTLCTELLSTIGEVAWIEDESQMDAVTAVSGSGPAYVFWLAECMAAGGVAAGLDKELAAQLAVATVAGSGALLDASPLAAGDLRKNVTSPGGTTAAALDVLMSEDDGLKALMERAVAAAQKRGRELSS